VSADLLSEDGMHACSTECTQLSHINNNQSVSNECLETYQHSRILWSDCL